MRWVACIIAVIVFGLISTPAAFAHDDVVGTSPSNGDRLAGPPDEVRITFAEGPRSGAGSITDPNGKALRAGKVRIDAKALVIPMRQTTALGTFTVDFHAVSADGHPTSGTLSFEVIQQSTPDADDTQAPANESASSTPDGGAGRSLAWLWTALAGGVGLATVGLLIARAVSRARKP